jgi:diguanylate cyclase (GGDEF)-like protein
MPGTDNSHFRFSLLLKEIDNMWIEPGVSTIAMVLIQLDGMKEINERFGYLGGDKVLKEFAVRLARVVNGNGRAVEITGTSFAVIIANPLHEGDALAGAERIGQVAAKPVTIGTGKARVHARMGLSILPDPATTAEELLRQCELALAQARRDGETYRVYTPDLRDGGAAGRSWFDVDAAVGRGELELHYQPRLNLRTGGLVGAEALIRWRDPRAGEAPPSYFMPDIRSMEAGRALLKFVLNASLARARGWIDHIPGFDFSVNLTAQNVFDRELLGVVDAALESIDFPAGRLLLEVAEEVLAGDEETICVQFNKLRARGVRIAIDDFGTGHSSLLAMRKLPIDQVKIDPAFVVPCASSPTDRRLVAALAQLGRAFGLDIVAEGVEDADIMETLLSVGCETGEGFHFGRPIPAGQFEEEWVRRFTRTAVVG